MKSFINNEINNLKTDIRDRIISNKFKVDIRNILAEIKEPFERSIDTYDEATRQARTDDEQGYQELLKIDDVVLVESVNKPRPHWQMGRIVDLLPGSDGVTRTVKILRPDRTEGVYPINHLYPLEISISPSCEATEEMKQESSSESRLPVKRRAAIACRERLRNCN